MPNRQVIIDASVAVKWFHEEPDTAQAEEIERKIIEGEIRGIIPTLLFYEVANALTFKADSQLEAITAAHHVLTGLPLHVVEATRFGLLEDSVRIAREYHVSLYDAVYVALAISFEAPLITADKKLAQLVGLPTVQLLSAFR